MASLTTSFPGGLLAPGEIAPRVDAGDEAARGQRQLAAVHRVFDADPRVVQRSSRGGEASAYHADVLDRVPGRRVQHGESVPHPLDVLEQRVGDRGSLSGVFVPEGRAGSRDDRNLLGGLEAFQRVLAVAGPPPGNARDVETTPTFLEERAHRMPRVVRHRGAIIEL